MNLTLVDLLDANKGKALAFLKDEEKDPSYEDMVKFIISLSEKWDSERITEIDHGDYQGSIIFVVGAEGYQPQDYIYTQVYYGSCSGCDALEDAMYGGPNPGRNIEALYKILHDIASGFREMNTGDKVV